MTVLHVRHITTYRYRRAVVIGPHRLMIRPRDSHDLRLINAMLTTSPSAMVSWSHDVFGNSVAHATFEQVADTLRIESEITVEQNAPAWPVFAIDVMALEYPFAYSEDEKIDLGGLLQPQYHDPERRLKRWADAFVRGAATDTLSLLKDMNVGIANGVSYQMRDVEGTQGPLETLERGVGTCRDFAVLLAEAVRALGFAARIVSGYLYQPKYAADDFVGAGSTHAWVEIYLPGAGWIAFDPTNRALGGANLIRVAVARHVAQTSPISGSFVGTPGDLLGMDVSVDVSPIS